MTPILLLHIFATAFWFGLIAVETVVELQAGRRSHEADYDIAHYHYLIDTRLEIPTLIVVLVTGLALFDPAQFAGLYAVKIVCGLIAVAANIICVVPVLLRERAAQRGDHAAVITYSRQIVMTIIAAPAALAALAIGMFWLAGGS
jgi:hypothetical protein